MGGLRSGHWRGGRRERERRYAARFVYAAWLSFVLRRTQGEASVRIQQNCRVALAKRSVGRLREQRARDMLRHAATERRAVAARKRRFREKRLQARAQREVAAVGAASKHAALREARELQWADPALTPGAVLKGWVEGLMNAEQPLKAGVRVWLSRRVRGNPQVASGVGPPRFTVQVG